MLLSLRWIATGDRRQLPFAAALLGLAVLAKGLAPLALSLPLVWYGRRHWRDLLRLPVVGAFLVVALPWYLLCYLRNGAEFLRMFFWEQHVQRFISESLAHGQPFWFYLPVLAAALMPWTPALLLLARRALYRDVRHRFLLMWLLFVLVFFSFSKNKLPGYLLPLAPAAATLMGVALAEARRAHWVLPAAAVCLAAIPAALPILPEALSSGISRASWPAFQWTWLLPLALALGVYWLERQGRRAFALVAMAVAATAGVVWLKLSTLPTLDRAYSARPIWRQIAGRQDHACIAGMHRSWRYGLNYYSVEPLADCSQSLRPLQVWQPPGQPPLLRTP
jgi:4-amino-4-deoxy-L-arabinose transferase-like glycosyltransferase